MESIKNVQTTAGKDYQWSGRKNMNKTNRLPLSDHNKNNNSTQITVGSDNNPDNLSSELQIRISFGTSKIPTALLTLKGNIVQDNLKLLRSAFDTCLSKGKHIIILSMKEIDSVSIAGWEYMLEIQEELASHNTIIFMFGVQPEVALVLNSQNFYAAFKIFSTIEECHKEVERIYALVEEKTEKEPAANIKPTPIISENVPESIAKNAEKKNDETEISVEEKIGAVIAKHGPCSFFEIYSHLHSVEFGKEKIGFLKLFFTLRELDLDSRKKRERFYRSC